MSGGSYDYLCHEFAEDLLGGAKAEALQNMIDRLAGLGYAQDAARETVELQLIIRQAQTRVEVIVDRLQPVWKAIEWWDSSDSGEDSVQAALAKYRGEPEQTIARCTWTDQAGQCPMRWAKRAGDPVGYIGWTFHSKLGWRCPNHPVTVGDA